jgi:hypothetical protein
MHLRHRALANGAFVAAPGNDPVSEMRRAVVDGRGGLSYLIVMHMEHLFAEQQRIGAQKKNADNAHGKCVEPVHKYWLLPANLRKSSLYFLGIMSVWNLTQKPNHVILSEAKNLVKMHIEPL